MRSPRLVLALVTCLLPLSAWADFTATYTMKKGEKLKVSYRDSTHIRMDVSADSFMLLEGEKLWMVNRQGKGWMAMDMSQMGGMMKGMMQQGQDEAESARNDAEFINTGRKETVAGYEGTVYEVRHKKKSHEIVLTDEKDVLDASKAMLEFSANGFGAMGGKKGFNPTAVMEGIGQKAPAGMLRQEDNIKLESINKDKLADSTFALPPGTQVQQMPQMPAGMPGMGGMGRY